MKRITQHQLVNDKHETKALSARPVKPRICRDLWFDVNVKH